MMIAMRHPLLVLVASAVAATPASAQVDNRDPARFVQSLAQTGFGVLQGDKAAARSKFRTILAQHFAVDVIGDRLIRRWRPQISASQYSSYKAAFPGFIVGTYADRLYEYADADIKVVRVQNQGSSAAVLGGGGFQLLRPAQRLRRARHVHEEAGLGLGPAGFSLPRAPILLGVRQP
jgi:phospholipid transport system substrate-binding protein